LLNLFYFEVSFATPRLGDNLYILTGKKRLVNRFFYFFSEIFGLFFDNLIRPKHPPEKPQDIVFLTQKSPQGGRRLLPYPYIYNAHDTRAPAREKVKRQSSSTA